MATGRTRAVKEGADDNKEEVEEAEQGVGDVGVVEVVLPFCSIDVCQQMQLRHMHHLLCRRGNQKH